MPLSLVYPPEAEPIELDEAKRQCCGDLDVVDDDPDSLRNRLHAGRSWIVPDRLLTRSGFDT